VSRLVALLVLGSIVALAVPGRTSAHIFRVDGDTGIVMHINPDDDPEAGKAAEISLTVEDKAGRFPDGSSDCDCRIRIMRNGIETDVLKPKFNGNVSRTTYTFTEGGPHELVAEGTSVTGRAFVSFKASFPYYVHPSEGGSDDATGPNPLRRYVPYVMTGSLMAVAALALMPVRRNIDTHKSEVRKKQ
jgi:hypothetical protein